MKCLSMLQPWATLVALAGHSDPEVRAAAKKIETRSWATPYRGPLAIHASKRWDAELLHVALTGVINRTLQDAGHGHNAYTLHLPVGRILCVCDLVDCIPITADNAPPEPERSFGNYSTEPKQRFAWHLDNVRLLTPPILVKGRLGLWTPAPDLMATLEQFYREAM